MHNNHHHSQSQVARNGTKNPEHQKCYTETTTLRQDYRVN